jgi:phosphopantothenoylcysteine decarboxylase/phosphopantothenate--cysteine ligase
MGAKVHIIAGHVSERVLDDFSSKFGTTCITSVRSAADMKKAVDERFCDCDILFMCAAVADYKPNYSEQKIKKVDGGNLCLELSRTDDILCSLENNDKTIVGFAA